MSYQVLARKWRPHTFKDMVGQESIIRMLSNALLQKRIHHAYLFTGTRGVGKTTLARILAKCLNCESGMTPTPCGTCHPCQAIDEGRFLDLYEVDAASRTKVEDTRELLDNVPYPPNLGRFKTYLIDEVHMLSHHSFNALLKTLEEPPSHVKFLLATTDPKRLPVTILSRCLQFHLKRITPEQITIHLQQVCKAEAISHEAKALEKLAHAAEGSLRDALSLLDQAIAYGNGTVNQPDVYAMLGSTAQDDLLPLLDAIAAQDGKQLFHVIAQFAERAPDFQQVLEELIDLFHKIAITQILPNTNALALEEAIAGFAKRFTPEEVQLYYQIALLGRRDLALSPSPQQGFEMIMLRMLAFKPNLNLNSTNLDAANLNTTSVVPTVPTVSQTPDAYLNSLPAAMPAKTEMPAKVRTSASLSAPTSAPAPAASAPAPAPTASAASAPTSASSAPLATVPTSFKWRDMLPKLELTGMAYALAGNCTLETITGNKIKLALSDNHQPMLNQKLKERIAEALSRYLNQPIELDIIITTASLMTPVKQQKHEYEQRLASATQTIMQDPRIKQFIEMYDATVEVSLVT